jgi:hypothetical protein
MGCAGGIVTALNAYRHGKLHLISSQVTEQNCVLSVALYFFLFMFFNVDMAGRKRRIGCFHCCCTLLDGTKVSLDGND